MSIVGRDNRTQVTNTGEFPFEAVSNVTINFSGSFFGGSAMLIGPNHAITAGHNAYDPVNNSSASSLRVTPGLNNTAPPFGAAGNVIDVTYLKNYNTTEAYGDDIAMFELASSFSYSGDFAGLTAFIDIDDADGRSITTAGYPISATTSNDGRLMYTASGTVVDTTSDGRMYYSSSVDTEVGQSGSGVWEIMPDDPQLRVIGVHAYGTGGDSRFLSDLLGNRNSGPLIDKDTYDAIVSKMSSDSGITNAGTLPENAIIGTDASLFGLVGGNDDIEGSYRKERVIAGSGDDGIRGAGEDDRIDGGDGVDRAIYAGNFEDFDVTTDGSGITTIVHTRGPTGADNEGTDTLQNVEFAVFEKENDADNDVFVVPLPLEDGPDFSDQEQIRDTQGDQIGTVTLTTPAWMFDKDIDYNFVIGSEQGAQINFAYIIDVSGSMSGSNLTEAKNAYAALTNALEANGVAQNSVFAVVPFTSSASLNAPLDSQGAISAIQALNARGGTSFGPALAQAEAFFSSRGGNTNIAYFLSDGQGSGASPSLQTLDDGRTVEVRAFGIGNADIAALNIIDSDNAVQLSNPSQLITQFGTSVVDFNTIDRIEVRLDGVLVDTVAPGQLTQDTLGLSYDGSISGLDVSKTAANQIEVEVFFNDSTPSATVDTVVTTGQTEIVTPTEQGTKQVTLAVAQADHVGDAESARIIGNNLANTISTGGGSDEVFAGGGNDRIELHPDGGLVDGGSGIDTAVFSRTLAEVGTISKTGNVVNIGSSVTLLDVEFAEFTDTRIELATLAVSPEIGLPNSAVEIIEGSDQTNGTATVAVTLSQAATVDTVIDFESVGGSATPGQDYDALSGTLTIAAGDTSGQIDLTIRGDDMIERNETVDLRLTALSGGTFIGGLTEAFTTVNIVEDDSSYTMSFIETQRQIVEGIGGAILRIAVDRFGDTRGAETVDWAVIGSGSNAASVDDFVSGSFPGGTLTFADGQTQATIEVALANDSAIEPEETFEIQLSSASDSSALLGPDLSIAILDDDSLARTISGTSASEILTGNIVDNELIGNGGSDLFRGYAGADTYVLGEGSSVIEGTVLELLGDTVRGFGADDLIRFTGSSLAKDDFQFSEGSAIIQLAGAGTTSADPALRLEGDFSSGSFFALSDADGASTHMFFAEFLPDSEFIEGRSLSEDEVNGGPRSEALTGDGTREFNLFLRDLGFAGFNNSLGVYEIDPSGQIVDTRLLFANTKNGEGTSTTITGVDQGHSLGFFIVQDGARAGITDGDTFQFVDASDGGAAQVTDGANIDLLINGIVSDVIVFHSADASMNLDGLEHVRFGAQETREALIVGFEDLLNGGDRDFEDVVFELAWI